MPSPASAGRSPLPEPELERRLAAAHGCPPDCPHCAAQAQTIGVPDLLQRFFHFITTDGALRMVRHCQRTGRPFPTVSRDEVVQILVEEACYERLHYAELLTQHMTNRMRAGVGVDEDLFDGGLDVEAQNGDAIAEAIARAREFAETG